MTLNSIVLSGAISDLVNVLTDANGLFTGEDFEIGLKRFGSALEAFTTAFCATQDEAIELMRDMNNE